MEKKKTPKKLRHQHYEKMLTRVHDTLSKVEHHSVKDAFELSKTRAIELGELTKNEAEEIASFVLRDLEDAAQYIKDTGENAKRWLRFDLEYLEKSLWDMFSKVADKTVVERAKFNEQLKLSVLYRTGEIVGVGSLQCRKCGQVLAFHKVSTIPPCANCHGVEFSRIANT